MVECFKPAAAPNFVLKITLVGVETEFQATGVQCPQGKLTNAAVEGMKMGTFTGSIEFTGMPVKQPVGCSTSPSNKTVPLVADLQTD
jgi:hypothetical protein